MKHTYEKKLKIYRSKRKKKEILWIISLEIDFPECCLKKSVGDFNNCPSPVMHKGSGWEIRLLCSKMCLILCIRLGTNSLGESMNSISHIEYKLELRAENSAFWIRPSESVQVGLNTLRRFHECKIKWTEISSSMDNPIRDR